MYLPNTSHVTSCVDTESPYSIDVHAILVRWLLRWRKTSHRHGFKLQLEASDFCKVLSENVFLRTLCSLQKRRVSFIQNHDWSVAKFVAIYLPSMRITCSAKVAFDLVDFLQTANSLAIYAWKPYINPSPSSWSSLNVVSWNSEWPLYAALPLHMFFVSFVLNEPARWLSWFDLPPFFLIGSSACFFVPSEDPDHSATQSITREALFLTRQSTAQYLWNGNSEDTLLLLLDERRCHVHLVYSQRQERI